MSMWRWRETLQCAMSCEEKLKVIETGEAEWGYWNNVQLFPYHGLVFGHKNLRKNKWK